MVIKENNWLIYFVNFPRMNKELLKINGPENGNLPENDSIPEQEKSETQKLAGLKSLFDSTFNDRQLKWVDNGYNIEPSSCIHGTPRSIEIQKKMPSFGTHIFSIGIPRGNIPCVSKREILIFLLYVQQDLNH